VLQAFREAGLEINTEKAVYMVVSCHQNTGLKKSFENVAEFKYFETIVTNQNYIHVV